jgi:hypothetical protein
MAIEISKNEINSYHSSRNSNQGTASTVNKSIENMKSDRNKRKEKRDANYLPII